MNVQTNKKGFTIIEVVLVLAIAGLIFLMVFIALPALQRNQRDTQRRNDVSRLQTATNSYQTNARGALPTFNAAFLTSYLRVNGDTFQDPNGTDYTFAAALPASYVETPRVIVATPASKCATDGSTLTGGQGSRKVAFQMRLEGGGVACVNN